MKPTLADRINQAIDVFQEQDARVPTGKGPVLTPARTYISPTDAYEDDIDFANPTHTFAPGHMRAQWAVSEQQQASVPVTNLTSSGNIQSAQLAAIQGGIPQNPQAPASPTWATVPQMSTTIRTKGPVMIAANVTVHSSQANDQVGFAIYRDGQQIGSHMNHTLPVGVPTMIQMNSMDNPPAGSHVYSLYWQAGTGTLTANSNERNFYAMNLSPF